MASNAFGEFLKISTFGESHGKSIGVLIDGLPSLLPIDEDIINQALSFRRPGRNEHVSPRNESDIAQIISGTFDGKTTGAPLCILISNENVDSSKYEAVKNVLKPGHAQFTYLSKYGIFDYNGGGRASARETAARVAAGAVVEVLLKKHGIEVKAWLDTLGEMKLTPKVTVTGLEVSQAHIYQNPLFLAVGDLTTTTSLTSITATDTTDTIPTTEPESITHKAIDYLQSIKDQKDSIGGIVGFCIYPVPVGLGCPVYQKLEAKLASAMLSIPASKGFEIGSGFESALMRGTVSNDRFILQDGKVSCATNNAGGLLGGISTGLPITGRVAFKPTSSHLHTTPSVNLQGELQDFCIPQGSKHDPCVAIRAVTVVRAMAILTLGDALLMNQAISKEPI